MARTRRHNSEPQLPQIYREAGLIYGALITVVGLGSLLSAILHPLSSGILSGADAACWLVFLILFWLAFRYKKIGSTLLWKALVPLCIIIDCTYLAVAPGQTIYERIVYFILSVPLYLVAMWYAYRFMPGIVRKPQIAHEFLD